MIAGGNPSFILIASLLIQSNFLKNNIYFDLCFLMRQFFKEVKEP